MLFANVVVVGDDDGLTNQRTGAGVQPQSLGIRHHPAKEGFWGPVCHFDMHAPSRRGSRRFGCAGA
eukprot:5774406-Lingulodinium_polyedra.AAC.1